MVNLTYLWNPVKFAIQEVVRGECFLSRQGQYVIALNDVIDLLSRQGQNISNKF